LPRHYPGDTRAIHGASVDRAGGRLERCTATIARHDRTFAPEESTVPSINGIAHVQLTVSSMERSVPFYEKLLHSMEMVTLRNTPQYFYCIGGRTGVAISPAAPEHAATPFAQQRPGLHHLCFRARSREDVDAIFAVARSLGAKIIREPREDAWAPGYYSVLFEDPDGIRIEANFVPGKGHLEGRSAGDRPL
jgi:catechol 2,3-dioxygenase-like lactoylglutathione lyase family enzyme